MNLFKYKLGRNEYLALPTSFDFQHHRSWIEHNDDLVF